MNESARADSIRHHDAVIEAEARRLARMLGSYGVLTRAQLLELSGAVRWSRGRFSQALDRAVSRGLVRSLGHGLYASRWDGLSGATERHPGDGSEPGPAVRAPGADRIPSRDMGLAQSDFEHLLELRTGLRQFLSWSEQQAKAAGLTPAKHQLLLAIKGHSDPAGPTIGDLADHLVLRHHSVVGLVDRAVSEGLVKRNADSKNKSVVRVTLTSAGTAKLDALTEAHLQEIAHLAPTMRALWRALDQSNVRDSL